MALIERYGPIADAISRKTGRSITATQVKHWRRRARDPLPITEWNSIPGIEEAELDAWIARQRPEDETPSGERFELEDDDAGDAAR